MVAAQNEARAAGNDQIEPGHLVLGLLAEPDALAAKAILAQGVQLEKVRETIGAGGLGGLGVVKATAEADIVAVLSDTHHG